jgi:hypothetical protein
LEDVTVDQLQRAVESLHSCRATLAQTAPVREKWRGRLAWEGLVHIFDIEGHPKATRAYAWSSPVEGSDKRRFFAVLQLGAIRAPVDAVRAAIVAEHRSASAREKVRFSEGWATGWKSICATEEPPPAPDIGVPGGCDPYDYGYEQGRAVAGGK